MVNEVGDYKWSSHSAYINEKQSFVDTGFILSILDGVEEYKKFVNQEEELSFCENENRITITDEELTKKIKKIMKIKNVYDLLRCERKEMEDVIATVRQTVRGASIRQISRVTGISVGIVRHIE